MIRLRPTRLIACCLLLLVPQAPWAANGGSLKTLCSGEGGSRDMEICSAYITGVVSTMKLVNESKNTSKPMGCLPASMTGEQIVSIPTRYLRLHPERLNRDAAELVAAAFIEAYPCN